MNGDANRTECAFVDTWLDHWMAGRVPDAVAHRLEAHIATCERCARLAAVVRGDEEHAGRNAAEVEFLSAVLDRTSGSACARAESQLPCLVDEELDAASREMLEGHLAHCTPCSRLLAALQEAEAVLPRLADVQPPPWFAESVLRATTAAEPLSAGVVRMRGRAAAFGQWWLRVLARPRASLELAYAATVLLIVLFGNPVAAFHEAEQRAGRLAGTVPVARLTEELAVKKAAASTIERLIAPFVAVANAVANELSERWRQAHALMDQITARVADAVNWLATIDLRDVFGGQRTPARGQPVNGARPSPAGQPAAGRR